jgi:hypothetical protein
MVGLEVSKKYSYQQQKIKFQKLDMGTMKEKFDIKLNPFKKKAKKL